MAFCTTGHRVLEHDPSEFCTAPAPQCIKKLRIAPLRFRQSTPVEQSSIASLLPHFPLEMAPKGLAAFGLAGDIIQFVDYSSKIVSKYKEIHHSTSGTSKDAVDLAIVYQDLENICSNLSAGAAQASQPPGGLAHLAMQCAKCTEELLQMLSKVRAKDPNSKWQSTRAALKSAWSSSEIKRVQEKVIDYRSQLVLHMQLLQRYD
jgi:hypothetical protein